MGKFFNILKFLISAALFGATALVIGYYVAAVIMHEPSQFTEEKIAASVLAFNLLIFFTILFLPLITFLPERKITIRVVRFLVLLVLLAFLAYQIVDAPRPKDAYTIEDLENSEPVPKQLSFLVDALLWEKPGQYEFNDLLKEAFYTCDFEKNRGAIEEGWKQLQPYRILIDQLASYDRMVLPHSVGVFRKPDYSVLINYVYVYRAYALLQASQGNLDRAVRELSTLQRVILNGVEGSIGYDQKSTWFEMLQINLGSAYQVVREHELSEEQLQELQSAFRPLHKSVLSCKKALIEEYLSKKMILDLSFEEKQSKGLFANADAYPFNGAPDQLQELVYLLTFQRNRTALMLGDKWQSRPGLNPFLTKWEEILLNYHPEGIQNLNPPPRNLTGWLLVEPRTAAVSKDTLRHPKVMADMFANYLGTRLGENLELVDSYTNEPFRDMEKDSDLVSPGPDKVIGNADDVVLSRFCTSH